MKPARVVLALLAVLVVEAPAVTAAPADRLGRPLPLGPASLHETRSVRQIAPGVRLMTIVRGHVDPVDAYTVQVSTRATKVAADADAARLRTLGMTPEVLVLPRAQDDRRAGSSGFVVRDGGRYAQSAEATLRAQVLVVAGFSGAKAVHTSEDGLTANHLSTGPWVVQVLEVDPRQARLRAALSNDTYDGAETTSAMVSRLSGLAGVNGDFFVTSTSGGGTTGDIAGLSIIGGRLGSESSGSQAGLLLSGRRASVGVLQTPMTFTAGATATVLKGLNRAVGLISGCGGAPGSQPTSAPRRDATCTDGNDLVAFDSRYSTSGTPAGDAGVEAVVNSSGIVTELRSPRGGSVPTGGVVVAGTGTSATWLNQHAKVGVHVRVDIRLVMGGRAAAMPDGVVAGGPLLVSHSRRDIRSVQGGFSYDANPEFFHRFGLRRNNRTVAGVRADGTIVLITVDGRMPATSIGATFAEEADLLLWAGALTGLNLDGGGSTTMVVGDGEGAATVTNTPTDATGERSVGDALVVVR